MASGIKDCAKRYAAKTGCTLAEADKAMRTALEVIQDEILNNGGVSFIGTFSIETVQRKERNGINPATKEPHVVPAHKTLKISVGKSFKEKLNS